MAYSSPFRDLADSHDSVDPLCLSRSHTDEPIGATLWEFYKAALVAIEADAAQPAFFLARQLAEVGVKALYGPDYLQRKDLRVCHSIARFLDELGAADHDLLSGGEEQSLIVSFLLDLNSRDPGGDEGRYPSRLDGTAALATVCCADPALLESHLERLYRYLVRHLNLWTPGATS